MQDSVQDQEDISQSEEANEGESITQICQVVTIAVSLRDQKDMSVI